MNNLGGLLEKFKNIIGASKFQKDAVISVVRDVAKINLEEKDFDIKNFSIKLSVSPSIKNEIFMRKQKILTALKSALGEKSPKDIR